MELNKLNELDKIQNKLENYICLIEETIKELKKYNNLKDYNCIFCKECISKSKEEKCYFNYRCNYCFNNFLEIQKICCRYEKNTTKILIYKYQVIIELENIKKNLLFKIKNIKESKNIEHNIKLIKKYNEGKKY